MNNEQEAWHDAQRMHGVCDDPEAEKRFWDYERRRKEQEKKTEFWDDFMFSLGKAVRNKK